MSSALPPRPNKPVEESLDEKQEEYLSDKTKLEMAAGKEAVELSKKKLNEEMEAGRKAVELATQLRSRKA